jgi:hypothetical protein
MPVPIPKDAVRMDGAPKRDETHPQQETAREEGTRIIHDLPIQVNLRTPQLRKASEGLPGSTSGS